MSPEYSKCGNCGVELLPTIDQAIKIIEYSNIEVEQVKDDVYRLSDSDGDWEDDYIYDSNQVIDYSMERDEQIVNEVITEGLKQNVQSVDT
jgi:hypothetical protein